MTALPNHIAPIVVTCPLCRHTQPLNRNSLQDIHAVAGEPAALESITARFTCAGCSRDYLITLKPKPEAQAAQV